MANQRKGGSAAQNKRTKLIVTVAVIAVALLITFAPYMNLPFDIPTWGELLSGDKQTVQDGDALNAAFREYSAVVAKKKERPSVIQKLCAINPLEQAVKKDRVRHKDKGLEL